MNQIHYTLHPARLGAHIFKVTCVVKEPAVEGQKISMPAWVPGSYLVRDFSRHVLSMSAKSAAGDEIEIHKCDKSTWCAAPTEASVTFEYEVYAHDLSVRGAHLDTTHGFVNGTSVFVQVHGRDQESVEVTILPPSEKPDWRLATTLRRIDGGEYDFGRFQADDYDELIDHPLEMGEFQVVEYDACGIPHAMVLTGRCSFDSARLAADLKTLCEAHICFFGEPAPMDRYLFLTMVLSSGYGGLEHRASSSLMCSRDELPSKNQPDISDKYRRFLGLCSHEYFHLWNVKRIKPAAFTPYTLSEENYTELLWVFEGITSYYDDLALVRSGLVKPRGYLELLEKTINRVLSAPGRFRQSLAQSSYDAWIKLYKPDENSLNAGISYYTKGSLVALALDLKVRKESKGAQSLDDIMRAVWKKYGRRGMPESGFENLAMEVTGLDLTEFFEKSVRGTEDIVLDQPLRELGVVWNLRQEKKTPRFTPSDKPSLGIRVRSVGNAVTIASVLDGGPGQEVGLSAGDELVAIDGIRVISRGFNSQLRNYSPGDQLELLCFRRDELMTFLITVVSAPQEVCCLELDKQADADALARRAAWLTAG